SPGQGRGRVSWCDGDRPDCARHTAGGRGRDVGVCAGTCAVDRGDLEVVHGAVGQAGDGGAGGGAGGVGEGGPGARAGVGAVLDGVVTDRGAVDSGRGCPVQEHVAGDVVRCGGQGRGRGWG